MVAVIGCLPPSTGTRAGRQCVEGPEGEENHAKASTACHPWWRGARHPDQGDHRRRRRHPPHPQVAHRQEGRGPPASPIGLLLAQIWPNPDILTLFVKFSPNVKNWRKEIVKKANFATHASKRSTLMQTSVGSLPKILFRILPWKVLIYYHLILISMI